MPRIFLRLITVITALFGLALFLSLALLGAAVYFNSAPAGQMTHNTTGGPENSARPADIQFENGAAYLELRRGESAQSVGQRLEQAGLIRSRYFWYLLCRVKKSYLKSGHYRLDIPASQMAIYDVLASGRQILQRVTIPEGVTLKKAARIFEAAGICPSDDFLAASASPEITAAYNIPNDTMEGYLFPDTYLFPADYPAPLVARTMADTFFRRIAALDVRALEAGPEALNNKVIIASIVEREYRVAEEAPLMAGVFYNRLQTGMALQSCATVEYVITEIQGRPHPEVLSIRDTEIRDPYNTYIRPGLPPGPICAPGAVALQAAFKPAASDFLYFRLVNPQSGGHYFSKTLDEHIRAGVLYVKGRR
ncbi:MAG: endolytic transglycosylase MltG [Treponema sp.]|nr:endolytic transglycosylase MltG [Treponema sp.]